MINIRGLGNLKRNLKLYEEAKLHELEGKLYKAGLMIERESKKLVPVDTGDLRGSGRTEVMPRVHKRLRVVIYYTKEYAVFVHEDLGMRHTPGQIAKYLERPLRRLRPNVLRYLASKGKK